MLRRSMIHLLAALLLVVFAGCAGGGCSGCGATPLPGGFPLEKRVENAGSLRLTQAGVDFLAQNIGPLASTLAGDPAAGGVVTFAIPESVSALQIGNFGVCDLTICPGGADPGASPPRCTVELDLKNTKLTMETLEPSLIALHGALDMAGNGGLPVRLQDLPVEYSCAFGVVEGTLTVVANGNEPAACPGEPQDFASMGFDASIAVALQQGVQAGYSRPGFEQLALDQAALDDALDLGCGGGADAAIAQAAKALLLPLIVAGLQSTLQTQLDSQLCRKAEPTVDPPCPIGTLPDDGVCKNAAGQCVAALLGGEGNLSLSSFVASVSPGTRSGLDFLFAAGGQSQNPATGAPWGQLDPAGKGATLGMYGGALARPPSTCVELANMPLPQGIPVPDQLFANTAPGWPSGTAGPHLGFALSEELFNYALASVYDSGLLCLGVTAATVPDAAAFLNTKSFQTFFGIQGLEHLGLQDEVASIAVVLRPGAPPHAEFGAGTAAEPLVSIALPDLAVDFYVWSLDRFVRFMTLTYDVNLGLDLVALPEGLTPTLTLFQLEHGEASNLVWVQPSSVHPDTIAAFVQSTLAGAIGTALEGVKLDINGPLAGLGLSATIPEEGIGKLSQGSHDYLGVFAAFEAGAAPPPAGGGCAVASGRPGGGLSAWLLGALALGAVARRAWRRAAVAAGLVLAMSTAAGCNCSSVVEESTTTTTSGGCSDCEPLTPGLAGAYTSVVSAGGKLWVAGYLEKSISAPAGDLYTWGDLVVGVHDGTHVAWEVVDGLPEGEVVDPTVHDPEGFRRGLVGAGDDVGLWTSIAVDDLSNPAVAYHDRTHEALKLARRVGSDWTVQTVQKPKAPALGEVGRYAKLLFVNGVFEIAYLFVEPGENGALRSGVRVATSTSAEPAEGEWSFEDVVSNPDTPLPEKGATTYANVTGAYVAVAATKSGIGIVYHDHLAGHLAMAEKSGGAWVSQILDGEVGGAGTGNVGIGASLFIAGDTWHVAYTGADDRAMRYLQVDAGVAGARELVDDGTRAEGETFAGRHAVGDDTSIHVTAGGVVHVSYQDATDGTLRHAIGTPGPDGHTWKVAVLPQAGFGGWFSQLVEHDGELRAVNWVRGREATPSGDVAVLTP